MGFYKQTTDFDLGETSIENVFIDDFMPRADGTAVKVYLLAFKYSQTETVKNITNKTIAEHLKIPLEDVLRSWEFWADTGIVKKIERDDDFDIEFLSLRQLVAKGLYRNQTSVKNKTKASINMIEASKNPDIKKMFYQIDKMMQRQLVPNERNVVLDWVYKQNIDLQIIERAFKYCIEDRGVKHINYVASVVRGWHDKGILTLDQLDEHFAESQSHYRHYKTVYKTLGYPNKMPTAGDKEIIDVWLDTHKLDIDFIVKVLTETSKKTSNVNMNYMNKAIETLVKNEITTIEAYDAFRVQKTSTSQTPANSNKKYKKNQFHNFKQRDNKYSNEELEKKLGIRK